MGREEHRARTANEAFDKEYEKALGFAPPYHNKAGEGIVGAITKIMNEAGGNNQVLVDRLHDLYTAAPFDKLNAWPATRQFLIDALHAANRTEITIP